MLGAKFLTDEQQELFLNHNIQESEQALANSLENAKEKVGKHDNIALNTQEQAQKLLRGLLYGLLISIGVISALILCGNNNFNGLLERLGAWSLILFHFPVIVVLTIITILFRHHKRLLDEVRHYSADKRQI